MTEILPCPECHEQAGEIEYFCSQVKYVECENCGYQGPLSWNEAEAITAWNTRASPAPVPDGELVERIARAIQLYIERRYDSRVVAGFVIPFILSARQEGWNAAIEAAWRAAWTADPLPEHPVDKANFDVFRYGRDCAMAAVRALKDTGPAG